jgi:GH24 family phage-related lysozyme (muramidase)
MAGSNWILPIGILAVAAVLIEAYRQSQTPQLDYGTDTGFDTGTPAAPMSATTLFRSTVPFMQYDPQTMNSSAAGLQNIINWEGRSNSAYLDNGKPAIGIGHDIVPGDGLDMSSVITDATMNAIFANDIDHAEQIVKRNVHVPLTQGQFDALVDFTFQFGDKLANGGPGGGPSTLLAKLNAGDYTGARAEFGRWINEHNAAGQLIQVPELIARRSAAATMFG